MHRRARAVPRGRPPPVSQVRSRAAPLHVADLATAYAEARARPAAVAAAAATTAAAAFVAEEARAAAESGDKDEEDEEEDEEDDETSFMERFGM